MRKPSVFLLIAVCVLIGIEILIFRPQSLDSTETASTGMFKDLQSMVEAKKKEEPVGYTIDGFHYTAVEGETKHWELYAKQAVLYEKSRVVSAKQARIKMFDQTQKITLIDGDVATYKMGSKDLLMEGNVKVVFDDGFWMKTERVEYVHLSQKIFTDAPVYGETVKQDELLQIWGLGFEAFKNKAEVFIPKEGKVRMRRLADDEISEMRSDQVRIDRVKKVGYFSMRAVAPGQPARKVESNQGSIQVRSLRQDVTYDSNANVLSQMNAYGDVLIEETDLKKKEHGLRYAKSQKAEFLTRENKILLSGFPSAYQEHDTLTGELIIIHRSRNVVEVTQANAYHEGVKSKP